MNVLAFAWGVILFIPLSGIAAAVYLTLALARRGVAPAAPAVARAGGPSGLRLALIIAVVVVAIIVAGSLLLLFGAGSRVLTSPP